CNLAASAGVTIYQGATAETVAFSGEKFTVSLSDGSRLSSRFVVGAFGKRANLDRQLDRKFFRARTPYLAVKYHLRASHPKDQIALHNFRHGYAGISAIEDNKYCFCYLTTRRNLEEHRTLGKMEEKVLRRNPHLDRIFGESEFLYPQPEVINQISFAPKKPVENHILCTGDAAGLITPLCGNGMAMAIHSGKLVTEALLAYFNRHQNRQLLEKEYAQVWQQQFGQRLQTGRLVQKLFGREILSEITVGALQNMPAAVRFLMRQTHGQPF
ncbi:MAG TPA: FAD-dependent monooxygenase, partial [Adhaeribacter sp.]|nr:FAD-dependent monooxygenase [Adhaeribacter sp.]